MRKLCSLVYKEIVTCIKVICMQCPPLPPLFVDSLHNQGSWQSLHRDKGCIGEEEYKGLTHVRPNPTAFFAWCFMSQSLFIVCFHFQLTHGPILSHISLFKCEHITTVATRFGKEIVAWVGQLQASYLSSISEIQKTEGSEGNGAFSMVWTSVVVISGCHSFGKKLPWLYLFNAFG